MATITVLSQKGGTGKTTTVRTLTDVFQRLGLRVLTVDLDPQGNLSDYFDLPPESEPTIADVLAGTATATEAIHDGVEVEAVVGHAVGQRVGKERAAGQRRCAGVRIDDVNGTRVAAGRVLDRERVELHRQRAKIERHELLARADAGDGNGRLQRARRGGIEAQEVVGVVEREDRRGGDDTV